MTDTVTISRECAEWHAEFARIHWQEFYHTKPLRLTELERAILASPPSQESCPGEGRELREALEKLTRWAIVQAGPMESGTRVTKDGAFVRYSDVSALLISTAAQ
jgi:hypothetical protein